MVELVYIDIDLCCAQILWNKQTLSDFDLYNILPIKCDNTSVIYIFKNSIQHSRTKHIEIRHHFLRVHTQKNDITIQFVSTIDQLNDLFTKLTSKDQFNLIKREFGLVYL